MATSHTCADGAERLCLAGADPSSNRDLHGGGLGAQAALYGEWRTEVFDKIQGRLQRAVDARSERDIMARLKVRGRVRGGQVRQGGEGGL